MLKKTIAPIYPPCQIRGDTSAPPCLRHSSVINKGEMLMRKIGPFALSHSFSFTSVMSHPVCCSHSWEKTALKEKRKPLFQQIPQTNREPLYIPLSSQPPLLLTESLPLSVLTASSLPPSISLHLSLSSPIHLSSPLSCSHSPSSSSSLRNLCKEIFPFP